MRGAFLLRIHYCNPLDCFYLFIFVLLVYNVASFSVLNDMGISAGNTSVFLLVSKHSLVQENLDDIGMVQ